MGRQPPFEGDPASVRWKRDVDHAFRAARLSDGTEVGRDEARYGRSVDPSGRVPAAGSYECSSPSRRSLPALVDWTIIATTREGRWTSTP